MNTITGWDQLEDAVDRLAHVFEALLNGPGEMICSLKFDEAEALAEVPSGCGRATHASLGADRAGLGR